MREAIGQADIPVTHIEDAWYPTHFNNPIMSVAESIWLSINRIGNDRDESLIPFGIFFPSEQTSNRLVEYMFHPGTNSIYVMHNPTELNLEYLFGIVQAPERFMLEICPLTNMDYQQILKFAQLFKVKLVHDHTHTLKKGFISYPNTHTKENTSEWERQFNLFAPWIGMVDLSTRSITEAKIKEFLAGKGELNEVLQAAREIRVQTIRVETFIPIRDQWPTGLSDRGKEMMKDVRDKVASG